MYENRYLLIYYYIFIYYNEAEQKGRKIFEDIEKRKRGWCVIEIFCGENIIRLLAMIFLGL